MDYRKKEILSTLNDAFLANILLGYQVGPEYDEDGEHTGRYQITLFLPTDEEAPRVVEYTTT